jgi:hypothetical protein
MKMEKIMKVGRTMKAGKIIGICSIVAGGIFFIYHLTVNVNGASQQTVQYLGFLIGAVFIAAGLLLVANRNN